MKKLIGVTALSLCLLASASCVTAHADEQTKLHKNEEIKIGNYYLNGDVSTGQYIAITEGFGFQYVGFDFYEWTCELNKERLDSLEGEEKDEVLASIRRDAELRERPRYYQIAKLTGDLIVKDIPTPEYVEGLSGEGIYVIDENTLQFDDEHIYCYVEE